MDTWIVSLRCIAASLCVALAIPIHLRAQVADIPDASRIRIFPTVKFVVSPASVSNSPLTFVMRGRAQPLARVEQVLLPDANGAYSGTFTCPFYGPGSITALEPDGTVVLEIEIACELEQPASADDEASEEPSPLLAATAASPSPAPMTKDGFVVFEERLFQTETTTHGVLTQPGRPDVVADSFTRRLIGIREGFGERCTSFETLTVKDGETTTTSSEGCGPGFFSKLTTAFVPFGAEERTTDTTTMDPITGVMTHHEIEKIDRVPVYRFSLVFPGVPEEAIVKEIRIGNSVAVPGFPVLDAPDSWRIDDAPPVATGGESGRTVTNRNAFSDPAPTGSCGDSRTGARFLWVFSDPVLGANNVIDFEVQVPQVTVCSAPDDVADIDETLPPPRTGTTTRVFAETIASITLDVFELDYVMDDFEIVLSVDEDRIDPKIPATRRFPAREASTRVEAMVSGGMVGDTVTVNFEIVEFDAEAGGHLGHGPVQPPVTITRSLPGGATRTERGRGELVGGEDPLTASCTATLEDPGGGDDPIGFCEVEYESGIVSGVAAIRGSIEGSSTAEDEALIDVAIPLFNVAALFQRNGELARSPDTGAFHPQATFLDLLGFINAIDLQRNFERITRSAAHPSGLYLSLNDMSTTGGGLFDIHGTWGRPHNSHRLGTSLDANRLVPGPFDVETQEQVGDAEVVPGIVLDPSVPEGVRVDRGFFNIACEQSGGFVVVESALHCDWRGRL